MCGQGRGKWRSGAGAGRWIAGLGTSRAEAHPRRWSPAASCPGELGGSRLGQVTLVAFACAATYKLLAAIRCPSDLQPGPPSEPHTLRPHGQGGRHKMGRRDRRITCTRSSRTDTGREARASALTSACMHAPTPSYGPASFATMLREMTSTTQTSGQPARKEGAVGGGRPANKFTCLPGRTPCGLKQEEHAAETSCWPHIFHQHGLSGYGRKFPA